MYSQNLSSVFRGQLHVPEIEIHLSDAWSSLCPTHRFDLREAARSHVGAGPEFLDLQRLPESVSHSISISHCKGLGGFAVARAGTQLGFDVEVNNRLGGVKLSLVCADSTELTEAPSLQAFWTIKEAAFKCLRGANQPRGLKDIRVGGWLSAASGQLAVYLCEIQQIDGQAVGGFSAAAIDDGKFSYAVCVKRSK